jgi:hypothetical protein
VVLKKSWRWTQWVILILTAILYVLSLFMKETYKKAILARRARKASTISISRRARFMAILETSLTVTYIRPLDMITVEPVVLVFGICQFFVVAFFYTLNAAVPYVFLSIYRFKSGEQGLAYIGFGTGSILGLATAVWVAKHKIRKIRAAAAKGIRIKPPPEARLQLTRIGGVGLPVGIFWWGWSLQAHIDWICPILAMVVICWTCT